MSSILSLQTDHDPISPFKHLPPNIRDICEGKRTDLTIKQIEQFDSWCSQYARSHLPLVPNKPLILQSRSHPVSREYSDFVPTKYPGTNLSLILKKYKVTVISGCNCESWINQMNTWGVAGCRLHRQQIKERLQAKADELRKKEGLASTIKIGFKILMDLRWPSLDNLIDWAISSAEEVSNSPTGLS